MPNWNEVLLELESNARRGSHDHLRLKYLEQIHNHTGRNVLTYYSGWLHKPQLRGNPAIEFHIVDADKTGFMTCSHGVDRTKGLDLVLHTPGGDVAATESLIDYLYSLYAGNIRAIIPQLAMSGGTLMALSCREIIMGRQSSIGPIDPQIANMPAQGILDEFDLAADEIKNDPSRAIVWQPIIAKYWPTLITSAAHAIDWSEEILKTCLKRCMFARDTARVSSRKIRTTLNMLGKQANSKSHARHINPDVAKSLGLNIVALEDDQELQDLVLTLHHAYTHTLSQTSATKIIENHLGVAHVNQVQVVMAGAQTK